MSKKGFTTRLLHTPYAKKDTHGSLRMPIYDSAAFEFDDAESLAGAFSGEMPAHVYSRGSNPTVTHLEQMIQQATEAHGVIALSSGMAAISNAFLAILEPGDNVITSSRLFGNTFGLFNKTLPSLGMDFQFVDLKNLNEVEKHINDRTRAIFVETISNPLCEVADIAALSQIAKKHKLVLVADTTMTPLMVFDAKAHGINLEIISSTKFISGGATAVGGLFIDYGTYDWSQLKKLNYEVEKYQKNAIIGKLRKEIFRNFGACMSPNNAYLQSLGLESFELRVNKACENTKIVAEWLDEQPQVLKVNYSGLSSSPSNSTATKQFGSRQGAILSFELASKEACMKFLNKLKVIRRATNLNDNKSLIIHPASTIYTEHTEEQKALQGITDRLIRFSVGIEDAEDLINDLKQAMA